MLLCVGVKKCVLVHDLALNSAKDSRILGGSVLRVSHENSLGGIPKNSPLSIPLGIPI